MAGGASQGSLLVHGTCVAMSGRGALLRGGPGSGKSDLALRFLSGFSRETNRKDPAKLVADDQVLFSREDGTLTARSPGAIAGHLEVRGLGIVEVEHLASVPLVLIVELESANEVPRLPPDPLPTEDILGAAVPVLKLDPFGISAPVKLKLALTGRI